jgi:hypothetical protein
MAVFTAIYKRVYRSLAEEFRKLYWLNKLMPELVNQDAKDSGIKVSDSDYNLPPWVVIPGADPTGDSGTVKQSKLDAVGKLLQMGTIDPMVFTRRVLDANEIPNAQQLIRQPSPPPPDPKAAQIQQEMQQSSQEHQQSMAAGQQDVQNKQSLAQIEQAKKANDLQHVQQMQALKEQGAEMDAKHNSVLNTIQEHQQLSQALLEQMAAHTKAMQEFNTKQVVHQQDVVHTQQKHEQTLTLAAQAARQKAKEAKSTKPK